ncbi:MAG TPA: hypothetical protein VM802_01415 [Chitinophaga sp.]|uniref:hypothetical protein n=1 Tax=Chitinophaga sp. TaxID=1869181 RepID=UPI002D19EC63|nr:hypothetical protein [Chitinophaga sp.]HVI43490.1 hypothetical protein [Chitinophaga sp.]
MKNFITILVLSLSSSMLCFSQNISNSTNAELTKVLQHHVRFPRELSEKKEAIAFSIKLTFSESGLSKVVASKFTPAKMIPQLTDLSIFQSVNWEKIFNRKVKNNDQLIIPIVIYNPQENSSTFYEYTLEDLFQYPGEKSDFINCLIMQTYSLHYSPAKI